MVRISEVNSMDKKRILIVDDEENLAKVFKLLLEKTGKYEVWKETNGSNAFATAKKFKPHLVLLDIMMPDIDGGEVASQLKEDAETKHIPIVFISAAITKEEEGEQGIIKGGYPILAKPVPMEKLVATIDKYTRDANEQPPKDQKQKSPLMDRRRHKRVKTLNLMAYECLDDDGNPVEKGMGKIRDISQKGLLLETNHLITSKRILLASSDIKEDLIDIKGNVIYSEITENNVYHTGIELSAKDDNLHRFVVELIKAFSAQKKR